MSSCCFQNMPEVECATTWWPRQWWTGATVSILQQFSCMTLTAYFVIHWADTRTIGWPQIKRNKDWYLAGQKLNDRVSSERQSAVLLMTSQLRNVQCGNILLKYLRSAFFQLQPFGNFFELAFFVSELSEIEKGVLNLSEHLVVKKVYIYKFKNEHKPKSKHPSLLVRPAHMSMFTTAYNYSIQYSTEQFWWSLFVSSNHHSSDVLYDREVWVMIWKLANRETGNERSKDGPS